MNEARIVVKVNAGNPDHHLYNNNGFWWAHYTVHRPDYTKQRVRCSLQTKCLAKARARRDLILANANEGGLR
jgi:hypothetical protein